MVNFLGLGDCVVFRCILCLFVCGLVVTWLGYFGGFFF